MTLILQACSLSNEKTAVFSGRVVTVSKSTKADSTKADSTGADTIPLDIADYVGYIIYDKQINGLFDDTLIFYGDEEGVFNGVLLYDAKINIRVPWLRKHVQVLFPDLAIDTHLTIDVYIDGEQSNDAINDWEALVAPMAPFNNTVNHKNDTAVSID